MQYLTCRVSDDRYGLPLEQVREIVGAVPITRVPGAPPALRGLAGHRGNPLPVVDLAVRLGFPVTVVGRRSCLILVEAKVEGAPVLVGLLVDGVDRIVSVAAGHGALPTSLEALALEDVCTGFGEVKGKLVPLLDPEALLRLEALRRARPRLAAPRPTSEGETRPVPASRPVPRAVPHAESQDAPHAESRDAAHAESRAAPHAESRAAAHDEFPAAPHAESRAVAHAGSQPSPEPAPGAAAAARAAAEPRGDAVAGGNPVKAGPSRPAGGERRLRHEDAARRPVETPRMPVGVAAPGALPRAWVSPAPASRPWAPLAPVAAQEATPGFAEASRSAARVSNTTRRPGVLAAVVAVALLVAGALVLLGWHDLGGAGKQPAPAAAESPRRLAAFAGEARPSRPVEPVAIALPAQPPGPLPGPAPAAVEPARSEASAARQPGAPVEPVAAAAKPLAPPIEPGPAAAKPGRSEASAVRQPGSAVVPASAAKRSGTPLPARQPAGGHDRIHEVRRGDSLWRLSRRYLGDPERWPEIFQRNRDLVADPNLIQPHQRLAVPAEAPLAPGR